MMSRIHSGLSMNPATSISLRSEERLDRRVVQTLARRLVSVKEWPAQVRVVPAEPVRVADSDELDAEIEVVPDERARADHAVAGPRLAVTETRRSSPTARRFGPGSMSTISFGMIMALVSAMKW